MIQKPKKITAYTKNVAKSLGYALGDVFTEYNPVIKKILTETKETSEEIYDVIKQFDFKKGSFDENSFASKVKKSADDIWNNFKDDLKTGNWYNKERQNALGDDMMRAMGFDMGDLNFDDDWGSFDDDWGSFDDEDGESTAKAVVDSTEKSTAQIISAVGTAAYSMTDTLANTTAESASYIVSSNNASARALYSLNEKGFGSINKGLAAINDSIASFAQVTSVLATSAQNASLFYTNTTTTLNEIRQDIGQIVKNTTPAADPNKNKGYYNNKTRLGDLFEDDGFSISKWKDLIKENFKEYKDFLDMGLDAIKGFGGGKNGGSFGKNISLMQLLTTGMVKLMIPKIFGESMKNFNEMLKYTIENEFVKMKDKTGDNMFLSVISELFFPATENKKTISTGKYNKGPVSWDGIARHALVDVIPKTLLRIESILNGGKEYIYDYDSGKFVTKKDIQEKFDKRKRDYVEDSEFYREAKYKIEGDRNLNDVDKKEEMKNLFTYFKNSFETGNIKKEKFNYTSPEDKKKKYEDLKISEYVYDLISSMFHDASEKSHLKFTGEMYKAIEEYNDYLRREESSGNSLFNSLFDNSLISEMKKSKNGTTIENTINNTIPEILLRIESLLGGSGRHKRAKKGKNHSSGEKTKEQANTSNDTTTSTSSIELSEIISNIDSEEDDENKEKDKKKKTFKDIFNKVSDAAAKLGLGKSGFFSALFKAPAESLSLFLDKLGDGMNELIFGNGSDKDGSKGIFGFLFDKAKSFFDEMDKKFKIKERFNKLINKLFGEKDENGFRSGGLLADWAEDTKKSFSNMGKGIGSTVKQFFGKGKVDTPPVDNGSAAHGRKVTKTGIVAVSEGELIVPSELNPYYHGITNKKEQERKEHQAANQFFGGFYYKGGMPFSNLFEHGEGEGAGHKYLREAANKIYNGLTKAINTIFGDKKENPEEQEKKDKSIVKEFITNSLKEIGDNKGATTAGALIGGGLGLLTGTVVGPFAGAAIGGAIGLASKSKVLQEILFGKEITDDDGNVIESKKGLIPKKIADEIKNTAGATGIGAVLGGAGGLFFGSPIIGAFAGAAVGFLSKSEATKKFLFGERNENGRDFTGLIPKQFADMFIDSKNTLIAMGLGGLVGGAVGNISGGPFGVVGGALLGSAAGFLSTSNSFRDFLFGKKDAKSKKRQGGLMEEFRTKVIDNIDGIFKNITAAFNTWAKNLFRNITEKVSSMLKGFSKKAKTGEGGPLFRLITAPYRAGQKLLEKTLGIGTDATGGILGKINQSLMERNIAKGYNAYDSKEKKWLNASERLNLTKNKRTNSAKIDELLAGIESQKDLNEYTDKFKYILNANADDTQANEYMEELKSKLGVKKLSKNDIQKALDKSKIEEKSRFNREAKEEAFRDKLLGMLEQWNEWFKKAFAPPENNEANLTDSQQILNGADQYNMAYDNTESEENVKYDTDMFGNSHKKRKNSQGEWVEDERDSETKSAREKMDEIFKGFKSLPLIGNAFSKFESFKDKVFGKKDEETGKRKGGILGGLDNIIDKVVETLSGGAIKNASGILKAAIPTFLSTVVGPGLFGAALFGAFDKLAIKITGGAFGKGGKADTATATDSETGETLKKVKGENGKYIYVNSAGEDRSSFAENAKIKQNSNASLGERLLRNSARGIITKTDSIGSMVLTSSLKSVDKVLVKAGTAGISDAIMDGWGSITKVLYKLPILKQLAGKLDDIGVELADKVATKVASKGVKTIADTASTAVIWVRIAFAAMDFMSGYEDARTTLKIVSEPTVPQRIVCGLLRTVKNLIPIVGSFIPDSILIDIFCKYVGPAFGIEPEELLKAREEAQETVDAYNAEHGTNYSVADYNKSVLKDYTFGERIWNSVKSTGEDTKLMLSKAGNTIKEKGLAGAAVEGVKSVTSTIMGAFEDEKGLAGVFNAAADLSDKFVPGIIGEILAKSFIVNREAIKGNIGEMWKVSLDDFGGAEPSPEDGVVPATVGIFSRIIGQIPLFAYKLNYTPVALIAFLIKTLKNKLFSDDNSLFNTLGKKLDSSFNFGEIADIAKSGDIKAFINYRTEGTNDKIDEKDIGGAFVSYIPTHIAKSVLTPVVLVNGVIKGIGKVFGKIGDFFKSGKFDSTFAVTDLWNLAKAGDIKGFNGYLSEGIKSEAKDGDFIGAFAKSIPVAITKTVLTPVVSIMHIGKGIVKTFKGVVNGVKSITKFVSSEIEYGNKIIYGKDEGYKFTDFFKFPEEDPNNPLSGMTKGIIVGTRLLSIPIALISRVGRGIGKVFGKIVNFFKSGKFDSMFAITDLWNLAKSGDIVGFNNYLSADSINEAKDGNFIKAFTKNIPVVITKTVLSPVASIMSIGKGIGKVFGKIVNFFKSGKFDSMFAVTDLWNLAKTGDIVGFNNYLSEDTIGEAKDGNFIKAFTKNIPVAITKTVLSPVASIMSIGKGISKVFGAVVDSVKKNGENLNTATEAIKEFSKESKFSAIGKIWSYEAKFDESDPLSGLWKAGLFINKIFMTVTTAIKSIFTPILDGVKKFADDLGITKLVEKAKEKVENAKDKVSDSVTNIKEKAGEFFNSIFSGFQDFVSGGASGLNDRFVSQLDPKYKDMKLGNSTVGKKGCGPAVASMLAQDYGVNLSMEDAVKSAQKYQDKNGTKVGYFKDVLGRSGIDTREINGGNIQEQVLQNLKDGRQVVLLGRDTKNKSKRNSPFGPNNHYVIVSGVDRNGNLIVRDPESSGARTYSPNILKNAVYGIGATSGGTTQFDTDIAKKVWGYFTSLGYSPEATAGIMGNLYQESGMDPTRIQDGSGHAAGIAQWESYLNKSGRFAELQTHAGKNRAPWTDLYSQLSFINSELSGSQKHYFKTARNVEGYDIPATTFEEFKNSSDMALATAQFEAAFERAGTPNLAKRIENAKEYYRLYNGSEYTGNYIASTDKGYDDNTYNPEDDANKFSFGNILSTISSIFSTALGGLFGNTNSSGTTNNTNFTAVNGAVGEGNEKQKALVNKLLGIKETLLYDMDGPRNPEKGSADCSSTVNWAYKNILGTDIGNTTDAILKNNKTEIIDLASNIDESNGGTNGSGPDLSKLMPGDLMLYSRPDGEHSVGRPYRVGHVEMYIGNGQRIGHGGGYKFGPNVTDATKDSGRYIMSKRLKGITDSAAGSGLYIPNYGTLARRSGGSSGLLLDARPGSYSGQELYIPRLRSGANISGGATNLAKVSTEMLNNIKTNIQEKKQSGSISSVLVEQLINAIIRILETIATNTSSVEKIYQVLMEYTKISAANTAASVANTNANNTNIDNEIDSNIINLVGTLAAIAKG